MGVSDPSAGGRGGRKSVDAELNLIPFIDLLSVCILFLLMTAVWVQISGMSALSQPTGEATVRHSEVSSITEMREGRLWDVLVRTTGVTVMEKRKKIGTYKAEDMEDVFAKLKEKLADPDNTKIAVRSADDVIYEDVIFVLDALMANNLTKVTIGALK
jgi:biopolymer transport protein TolR